jgi:hypothetical protein
VKAHERTLGHLIVWNTVDVAWKSLDRFDRYKYANAISMANLVWMIRNRISDSLDVNRM